MKLKCLGTGASEGIPAVFCQCSICRAARALGGREIRTTSQALIDDCLLVDLCPDTYMHSLAYGKDLCAVEHLLVTHSHGDHLDPFFLEKRKKSYSHIYDGVPTLHVYGSDKVRDALEGYKYWSSTVKEGRADFALLCAYSTYSVGKYRVTPMPANHSPDSGPLLYIIDDGVSSMLYGNDTGMPKEEVWDFLMQWDGSLDLVSLDCTLGDKGESEQGNILHNNLSRNVIVKERLERCGVVHENTKYVLTHFSHNGGNVLYRDLAPVAKSHGFDVTYDGMEIEF